MPEKDTIIWTKSPTDYTTGTGQIPFVPIIPSGDWRPWVRDNEPQKLKFDTNGCSQFSPMTSSVEAQLNYQLSQNAFSPESLAFWNANGFIVGGQFQLSIEFNAILSGTTINGNSASNFAISVQNDGIIPQSMLEMSLAESQQYNSQAQQDTAFYSVTRVTSQMKAIGIESLKYFNIQYQWVGTTDGTANKIGVLKSQLPQAPLTAGIPIPVPVTLWNQVEVPYTGGTALEHSVGIVFIDTTISFPYFIHDNYDPFMKQLSSNYFVSIVIQIVLTIPTPSQTPGNGPTGFAVPEGLKYGSVGISVYLLQNRLIQDGFASFSATGFFGEKTQYALIAYQTKYNLPQTGEVDAATALHFQKYG